MKANNGETTPQIVERGLTHVNTLPDAQVASENGNDRQKPECQGNKPSMRELSALAMQKLAELRANGQLKTPLQKFIADPRPLRAIRRFCYECNGFSQSEATNCTTKNCPLWLFRRGSSIIHPEKLRPWQHAYGQWMNMANETDRDAITDDDGFEGESEEA